MTGAFYEEKPLPGKGASNWKVLGRSQKAFTGRGQHGRMGLASRVHPFALIGPRLIALY